VRCGYDRTMSVTFSLTYDYLCPFARIANEAVITAVSEGIDWDVTFVPFSLAQTKVGPGDVAAWDRPPGAEHTRGIVAHQWALAVRDGFPERFPEFHLALYAARFDQGGDVDDPAVLVAVARQVGVDADEVAAVVAGGGPRRTLATIHEEAVARWGVFGVPTFIAGDHAVFVRLMERHRGDDVHRVVDMLTWDRLNEFKRTRVPR
jgi:DSBA-like thioredoxin domain